MSPPSARWRSPACNGTTHLRDEATECRPKPRTFMIPGAPTTRAWKLVHVSAGSGVAQSSANVLPVLFRASAAFSWLSRAEARLF